MPPQEDDGRGHEGHQLPSGEEEEWISRAEHECQYQQEDRGERCGDAPRSVEDQVACREDEGRRADDAENEEEEATRRVDAESWLERARERCPQLVARDKDGQPCGADERNSCGLRNKPCHERPGRARQRASYSHHDEPRGEKRSGHETPTLPRGAGESLTS